MIEVRGLKKTFDGFAALHPIFIDAVPLSLEEIFIYELGGEDYAIRDIVL